MEGESEMTEQEEFEFRHRLEMEQANTPDAQTQVKQHQTSPMDYWINNPAKKAYEAYRNDIGSTGNLLSPTDKGSGILGAVTHPIDAISGAVQSLPRNWGDVGNAVKGIPDMVMNHPLQTAAMVLPGMEGAAGLAAKGMESIPKIAPKIYNDAFVTGRAESMINKVKTALSPINNAYDAINSEFTNTPVTADVFKKALNTLPEDLRADALKKYSNIVLDESGRPTTTIGNLNKMEFELQDLVKQTKPGESLSSSSWDSASAKKAIKDIRLSQLPEPTAEAIRHLDSKFGPIRNASNEMLPKLVDRNGKVSTEFLYNTFSNPSKAGMRDYMRNLKNVGIDINPEISDIRGWVTRQGQKKFVKSTVDKIPGLGALGYGLHH